MEIHYVRRAEDELRKLSKQAQRRISTKMRFYGSQKDPLKFAKRLTGDQFEEYRFRIGGYRICFDVVEGVIVVLKIVKRDKVYE